MAPSRIGERPRKGKQPFGACLRNDSKRRSDIVFKGLYSQNIPKYRTRDTDWPP
jgi:hypothetical protein